MTGEERVAELERLQDAEVHRLWLLLEPRADLMLDGWAEPFARAWRHGRASCRVDETGICAEHGWDPLRCPLAFRDGDLEATG